MVVRLSRDGDHSGMPFRRARRLLTVAPWSACLEACPGSLSRCETAAMAYDEELAHRVRAVLGPEPGLTEKRMFGGLGFMVDGHMAVAASGQGGLMVRVDPAASADLVDHVHVERVVMRGREMDGWLRVTSEAVDADGALQDWVARGVAAARALG